MTEPTRVLIVAPSGRISDSLRVLLRADRRVTIVGQAVDSEAGLKMASKESPGLVLVSTDLPGGEAWPLLHRLRCCWPELRCCVIAHNAAEEQRARQSGAHAVLQAGFAAEDLYRMVKAIRSKHPPPLQED